MYGLTSFDKCTPSVGAVPFQTASYALAQRLPQRAHRSETCTRGDTDLPLKGRVPEAIPDEQTKSDTKNLEWCQGNESSEAG